MKEGMVRGRKEMKERMTQRKERIEGKDDTEERKEKGREGKERIERKTGGAMRRQGRASEK